jgi:uncharacterized protein (DUF1015 family)
MKIRPFRGYRFDPAVVADLSTVMAPPYDQIGPELQETLYAMSPHNIVRVTLNRDSHTAARRTLDAWLGTGVFTREAEPALYPYHQTYTADGRQVTRKGFITLGEVTDYAAGIVLPHERTHAGPKADRLQHLETTETDLQLLFMLVSDPAATLLRETEPEGPPLIDVHDLKGERHRLWRITDAVRIARIQALINDRTVIIADGHHRYETAVEYRRRRSGASCKSDAATSPGPARGSVAAYKMMAFFTLEAPGLTILPNHRLVHDLAEFSLPRLLEQARPWFEIEPLPTPIRPIAGAIVVLSGPKGDGATLRLRPDAFERIEWPAGTSTAWRRLAVSLLHEGILKPLLDITDEKLTARSHVDYTADTDAAVALVRKGVRQAAFIIPPTTAEELQAVVAGGEVLPQKSTHFYPKLLDGLVFYRFGEEA